MYNYYLLVDYIIAYIVCYNFIIMIYIIYSDVQIDNGIEKNRYIFTNVIFSVKYSLKIVSNMSNMIMLISLFTLTASLI